MEYIPRNAAILLYQMNYCFKQKFIKKSADFDNDYFLEHVFISLIHYIPHV